MATKNLKAKASESKRGPKPEIYEIEGNWEDVVKKSLQKKKPATGWPK